MIINKQLGKTDLKVSRLGLGTAELGFAYGIYKPTLPSEAEAIKLLQTAADMGITYFDTASYYGLAEERIGKSGIAKKPGIVVATKTGIFLEKGEALSPKEMEKAIRQEVMTSLQKLKLEVLPLLYLHGANKQHIKEGSLIENLQRLKDEGKIKYAGVSTRGEADPLAAIASGFFDVIQVAYSILDQRMARQVLPQADKHGVGVVNRSVLLKGALASAVEKLPSGLESLQANSRQAAWLAQELGMDLPTLALRFAISNDLIATSLIGTSKKEHVQRALRALEAGPLHTEVTQQLASLAIDDPAQIDPAQWPALN